MQKTVYENADERTPETYALAIDLGGGGHKVAIVADSGEIVASADERIDTHLLPDGGAEQDAVAWWDKAVSAAKRVIRDSGVPPKKIIAVGCDSQWSLAVPVDEHCVPLMNALHWSDTRGGRYNRKITDGFPKIQGYGLSKLMRWVRMTGLVPTQSGVDSLGHVQFIKNERPEIYKKTYKFLEPMDYLTARLTGRITATQKTMAAFMVVDNRTWGSQEYSDTLLNLAGLDREKFPEMIANDGVVGTLEPSMAAELGLDPATPVISGIGDSNVSLIGSGAVKDFEPIIYIGTTLYMTCHLPFKKTDLAHFMTSLPSPFPSRYYLLGEQGAGGKCVEFYLKNMIYADDDFGTGTMPEDAYERFNDMAADAPAGSGGVIFLPWFNGSIVPEEVPSMRAGFMNLSLSTTRRHMARAVFEALAFNNRWTRGPLEKFIGQPVKSFRFSGGGARSDLWSQIHADVLGVPIEQVDDPVNATVRGTAMLAFHTLGKLSLEDLAARVKIKRTFEPDPSNKVLYDGMYAQYRQLFKRNRRIFKALNS
ncbi:MAG: FGGY-family carbohydrate kinase [Deltaproteobacteria bacterium]|nr:FGGY-family carbohydrate kinase [Deltaproteobacteria bacterium]